MALFILTKVGSLLCNMVSEERRLLTCDTRDGTRHVSWRRQHPGVREMCDVCSTTIFNIHLTCFTCGIMVCHDCYTARIDGTRYRAAGNLSRPYRTRRRLQTIQSGNAAPSTPRRVQGSHGGVIDT